MLSFSRRLKLFHRSSFWKLSGMGSVCRGEWRSFSKRRSRPCLLKNWLGVEVLNHGLSWAGQSAPYPRGSTRLLRFLQGVAVPTAGRLEARKAGWISIP